MHPFALVVAQRPTHLILRIAEAQRRVRGQVLRGVGRTVALQVAGAGHQRAARGAQVAYHQFGIGIELGPHAQGQVHAFADQVDPAVGHQQLYRDCRPGIEEFRQQRRQHVLRD